MLTMLVILALFAFAVATLGRFILRVSDGTFTLHDARSKDRAQTERPEGAPPVHPPSTPPTRTLSENSKRGPARTTVTDRAKRRKQHRQARPGRPTSARHGVGS